MPERDHLAELIEQIHHLLSRQRLVENVVHAQQGGKKELVEGLLHRQHMTELRHRLDRLHFADIARLLEALPRSERLQIWQHVNDLKGGEVLVELADPVRINLIEETPSDRLIRLIAPLDADDITYLKDNLPDEVLQQHLHSMDGDGRELLHTSMAYPEDSVGNLMTREMVLVRRDTDLRTARRYLRRLKGLPDGTDKIFVVDERGALCGALTLEALLIGEPETLTGDVMAKEIVSFSDLENPSRAARAFERYDLLSAPVVNARNKPVGRLTVDVMMDFIRQDSLEDTLNLAGVRREEDLFSPVLDSARNRWPWLALNLLTAFIASRVIGLFEHTIGQLVSLAVLMPIVASTAGNSGNQTTALVIRGLALNDINNNNRLQLFRRELGVSLLNGLVWGSAVGLFTFLIYHDWALAGVISVAMLLNLILAAMTGVSLPLLLQKIGRDPAMGASILITATTDSLGFFIFLGLASWLLV